MWKRAIGPFLRVVVALGFSPGLYAQQSGGVGSITRSDSLDVLHTRVDLDLRGTGSGLIAGTAQLTVRPLVAGITALPLDLLQLTVDSVVGVSGHLAYAQVGELLTVQLGQTYGPSDTVVVTVHYQGQPALDPSGFGGFYTGGAYQYDLGVAFDAVPHSYGRSWFPCFDNFVERCTFEFRVRADAGRTVTANGSLLSTEEHAPGDRTFHWYLDRSIPAYLASVAAGQYVSVNDTYASIAGVDVPVHLAARAVDTTAMKASFLHLRDAFDGFEQDFGPYQWPRVGFTLTTEGAMEHATNICYPAWLADGSLTHERIMAHELAHHWFGNLITCSRAEEMWINEGMADLCGYMFAEKLYGRAHYMNLVQGEHHRLVGRLHLLDGGSYALSEVPQSITYGDHSYKKGADIGHTLRGYLGDDLFRTGFTRVMANNAFTDISSERLRDSLMAATGVDLVPFFNDWVFQPGWAAFEVDSIRAVEVAGIWNTTVHVEQKLRFADHYYQDVPVTVTFESVDGLRWVLPDRVLLGGASNVFTVAVPFAPAHCFLNDDGLLALATTVVTDTLVNVGTRNLARADLTLITSALPQAQPIRVEEFWVAADPMVGGGGEALISPDRWWRITMPQVEGFVTRGRFNMDGRQTGNAAVDRGLGTLMQNAGLNENNLRLLYRPDPGHGWTALEGTTLQTIGSATDGLARIEFPGMMAGDYAFGLVAATAVAPHRANDGWAVHPNPADRMVHVDVPQEAIGATLEWRDLTGRAVQLQAVTERGMDVAVDHFPAGVYLLRAVRNGQPPHTIGRVVVTQ